MIQFVDMANFQPITYVQIKNLYYVTPNRKSGFMLQLLYNAKLTESILEPKLKNLKHTNRSLHTFPEYKFDWASLVHLPKI